MRELNIPQSMSPLCNRERKVPYGNFIDRNMLFWAQLLPFDKSFGVNNVGFRSIMYVKLWNMCDNMRVSI